MELVTTFNGKSANIAKCRKIKGQYYLKGIDCILMPDKKWNRINNGKIARVTDDLVNYNYTYIGEIPISYKNTVVGYDENLALQFAYVHHSILERNKDLYGEKLYITTIRGGEYNVANIDILIKAAVYYQSHGMFVGLREVLIDGGLNEAEIRNYLSLKTEKERQEVLKTMPNKNEALTYNPRSYMSSELSRSLITCDGLKYNVSAYLDANKAVVVHDEKTINEKLTSEDVNYAALLNGTTFGVEIETNGGKIPLPIVRHYSFFPLRDGSINGCEYTSGVLSGKQGIYNLKKFSELAEISFKKSNQESFHVHIKRAPVTKQFVVNMFRVLKEIEEEMFSIFPAFISKTSLFKGSRKNYTNKLPDINLSYNKDSMEKDFIEIYRYYMGKENSSAAREYFSGFERQARPHPADTNNSRKWNINMRYHYCNLIPTLFNSSGTVEFRLHPNTFNYEKIMYWILIINAIVSYAEKGDFSSKTTFKNILFSEYGNKDLKITNKLYFYVLARQSFYSKSIKSYRAKVEKALVYNEITSKEKVQEFINSLSRELYIVESGTYETKNDSIDAFS